MRTSNASVSGVSREEVAEPAVVPPGEAAVIHILDGSSRESLDGCLCGLFAVDIVEFNAGWRDDEIQLYLHKSLYEMLQAAFNWSGVPWSDCERNDCGDGVLVVVPPVIPVAGMVAVPDRLHALVRRHNHVSSDAARIQLRIAMHIGAVCQDGDAFVGRDVSLLFRLLNSRGFRRLLSDSQAVVASIVSSNVYEQVIRRHPSLIDVAPFQRLLVRVKETRTQAWACTHGTLPLDVPALVGSRGRRAVLAACLAIQACYASRSTLTISTARAMARNSR